MNFIEVVIACIAIQGMAFPEKSDERPICMGLSATAAFGYAIYLAWEPVSKFLH